MAKISYVGCFALSLALSEQFNLEMFVAALNREKILKLSITKAFYFGGSRSFKVIFTLNKPIALK